MDNVACYAVYKGYCLVCSAEEDGTLHGRIDGIRDIVTFHAATPEALQRAFEEAVDAGPADPSDAVSPLLQESGDDPALARIALEAALQDARRDGVPLVGLYHSGAGSDGLARVLRQLTPPERPVWIGHELSDEHRPLLRLGLMERRKRYQRFHLRHRLIVDEHRSVKQVTAVHNAVADSGDAGQIIVPGQPIERFAQDLVQFFLRFGFQLDIEAIRAFGKAVGGAPTGSDAE